MSVDKFGRTTKQRQQPTNESTAAISLTQMNDTFLRRDGRNTVFGTINMTGNTLTNVSNPVHDHDAANKIYVDENAGISKTGGAMLGDLDMNNNRLTGLPPGIPQTSNDAVSWFRAVQLVRDSERNCVKKTGDIMTGNLLIDADGNLDRILGCVNLSPEHTFTISLGNNTNRLHYRFFRDPVTLHTDNGFLIRANLQDICRLGTTDDPPEIRIFKDVRMNSNHLTNLPEPTLPHEAANKLYVDTTPRKILQGYVPNLRSGGGSQKNDKFGFIVTASSYLNNGCHPIYAFNGLHKPRGNYGSWVTKGVINDFWIQIKCPDLVRLWRIALRGKDSNTERIYTWRLEGSTDGDTFTILYEAPNPTFIGDEVRYFPIDTTEKCNIFRLFCIEAESVNPGLTYMQLYVYSD